MCADGSNIKNTEKVVEPGVEVSNYFHKMSPFANYDGTTDQQKEVPFQTYAVKQKDSMAEEVSSKEATKESESKEAET